MPSIPVPSETTRQADAATRWVLACILLVAAWLRFYHLEVPSMWWDEIVVPLTARFPVSYILDFSRHCEMHPPLYHLLIKGVEYLGLSDFALRLPSAICGVATVYAAYWCFSRLYDRAVGLAAAAFLAGSAMQVWHVRQVRPYAILALLFVFSLYFLLRFIRERKTRDLYALLAVNAPFLALHYFSFQIVFAQGVVLAVNWRPGGGGVGFRQLCLFGLGTAVVALPILLVFFLPSQTTLSIFAFKSTFMDVGRLILDFAAQVLWSHDDLALRLGFGVVLAAGAWAMARRAPRELAACLLLALVPAAILLAMRKTAYFSPRHFLYLTVPAALLAGQATAWLPRRHKRALAPATALLLALIPAASILWGHPDAYYDVTSYKHPVFVTDYKPMARELTRYVRAGDILASAEPGATNAVSWYLDQYVGDNPFRSQHLDGAAEDFPLYFFAPFKTWGHLGKTEKEFADAVGQIDQAVPVLNATIYVLPIHREPVPVIDAVPHHIVRRMELPAFYRQVHAFSDMTINPYWGGEAIPTRNSVPAFLEYRFHNTAGPGPQFLYLGCEYKNQGQGNAITVSARFDDEPAQPLFTSNGPDSRQYRAVSLTRPQPYKTLTLRVESTCAPYTAQYPGGNLETAAFRNFELEIVPTGLFDSPAVAALEEKNIGKVEHNPSNIWRWGLGPQTELSFDLAEDNALALEFDFVNVIPGQNVTVEANGQTVAAFADLAPSAQENRRIAFAGKKGRNTLVIRYSDWNQGKTTFAATDVRLMSLFIRKLRIVD